MSASESGLQVDVTGGRIEGVLRRGLRMWRGIPYAATTAGENRFRAPQPVVPWDGIRSAAEFGPVAPQDRGTLAPGPSSLGRSSEDCLSLNVIAPRLESRRLRPVMVFIHGGAYAVGSSREMPQQGESLVRDGGVIFVNLNYRLGAFGFLDFARYSTPERPIESSTTNLYLLLYQESRKMAKPRNSTSSLASRSTSRSTSSSSWRNLDPTAVGPGREPRRRPIY